MADIRDSMKPHPTVNLLDLIEYTPKERQYLKVILSRIGRLHYAILNAPEITNKTHQAMREYHALIWMLEEIGVIEDDSVRHNETKELRRAVKEDERNEQ